MKLEDKSFREDHSEKIKEIEDIIQDEDVQKKIKDVSEELKELLEEIERKIEK